MQVSPEIPRKTPENWELQLFCLFVLPPSCCLGDGHDGWCSSSPIEPIGYFEVGGSALETVRQKKIDRAWVRMTQSSLLMNLIIIAGIY